MKILTSSCLTLLTALALVQPVLAETCTPLEVVGAAEGATEGARLNRSATTVKKSISPTGTFVTANNWNTDFAIPSGTEFTRYVATITPDSDGQYDIQLNLKYSDQTAVKAYNQSAKSLGKGKTYTFDAKPRGLKDQPYQVNVYFGGPVSTGKSYTLKVGACR